MSTRTGSPTPPSVNTFSRKEMAHFSWDIPNRLISLLRSLLVQGLAWDLVWSSWREHWKCLTYPERGAWGQLGQWSSYSGYWNDCTVPPFITVNNPRSETLKAVMAPASDCEWKRKKWKKLCPHNWGFFVTSNLVIKKHGVHVYFFLCTLIYKYWSGFPGWFLRNYVNYITYI